MSWADENITIDHIAIWQKTKSWSTYTKSDYNWVSIYLQNKRNKKITLRNYILIIIICKYTNFVVDHFHSNKKAANDRLH